MQTWKVERAMTRQLGTYVSSCLRDATAAAFLLQLKVSELDLALKNCEDHARRRHLARSLSELASRVVCVAAVANGWLGQAPEPSDGEGAR